MIRSLVVASLILAGASVAVAVPSPPPCRERPPAYDGASPRVVSGVAGQGPLRERYFAVLPTGYEVEPDRRYPVLYLLHGADSTADEWLVCTRLIELSESTDVIVVAPQGSRTGWWIDWHNGAQRREQALIRSLLPHIDGTFRTIPDRMHRAIAGLSMGGYGAFVQAARHPELFTAAASFSGVLGMSDPTLPGAILGYTTTTALTPGAFADPVTGAQWRRDHDPVSLAENLRGLTLFLASGNGVPCGIDEALRLTEPDPSQPTIEAIVRSDADQMHHALIDSGIEHTYRRYRCGAHTFVTFQRALVEAWSQLMSAIGAL